MTRTTRTTRTLTVVAAISLAAAVAVASVDPATAARDRATRYDDATVTWSATRTGDTVELGAPASVTVSGTDQSETAEVRVVALGDPSDYDGTTVGEATLTPDAPSATIVLGTGTGARGTQWYLLEISTINRWGDFEVTHVERHPLTVVGHRTRVTARIPSGTVAAGTTRSITGRVTGSVGAAAGRLVQVQAKGANGTWVTLASTRSAKNGTYRLDAPSWWVARQTLRVFVPAAGTAAAAVSTHTGTLTVRRTWVPRAGTAYQLLGATKARWNPCQVIRYRVNPHTMPRGALTDLRWAFGQVSEATGLRFSYDGRTTFVPYQGGATQVPDNADIVVAFSNPNIVRGLRGSTIGLGGSASSNDTRHDGGVVIDSAQRLYGSQTTRARLMRALYLHEIGHAIGLDHVSDDRQIMVSRLQSWWPTARYGAGDLAGLALLGAAGGCTGDDAATRTARVPRSVPQYRP